MITAHKSAITIGDTIEKVKGKYTGYDGG